MDEPITTDPLPSRMEPLDRSDYQSRQVALLRKMLGRELMRRGKHEETYMAIELDHALPANVNGDGRGNYLAKVES